MINPSGFHAKTVVVTFGLFVVALAYLCIDMPGTGDTNIWLKAIVNLVSKGVRAGYASNAEISLPDYPPLFSVILYILGEACQLCFGFAPECFDKLYCLSIFLFLCFGILATLIIKNSDSLWMSICCCCGWLLSVFLLKYTDIIMALPLFVSMLLLKHKKIAWATFFFCVSCCIKWQPIILLPVLAIYLASFCSLRQLIDIMTGKVIYVALVILFGFWASFYLYFGDALLDSFSAAMAHSKLYLNPNGANLSYIIGGAINAANDMPLTTSISLRDRVNFILFAKTVLFSVLGALWVRFFFLKKDFDTFLLFAVASFWTYYGFGTGVHENHLAVAVVLVSLFSYTRTVHILIALATVLAFNINLFAFYLVRLLCLYVFALDLGDGAMEWVRMSAAIMNFGLCILVLFMAFFAVGRCSRNICGILVNSKLGVVLD